MQELMSTFHYGSEEKMIDITGQLVARCVLADDGSRHAYIGTGVTERTSNFGYQIRVPDVENPTCRKTCKNVTIELSPDSEFLINLETGVHLELTSVDTPTLERLRTRWVEAGRVRQLMSLLPSRYPFISRRLWMDERPEQEMNIRFLNGTEIVLEIGGCIGRNSLIIASILSPYGGKLVTVEANPSIAEKLKLSRANSGFWFHIIDRPLSRVPMMIYKWYSRRLEQGQHVPAKWTKLSPITLTQLKQDSGVNNFDTLVVDCEGAFHGVLADFPDIMSGISKVLIENDSRDAQEAEDIHAVFRRHGLSPAWSQPLDSSKEFPKKHEFWQCWVKKH
jgi:hypothetical protein